MHFKAQSNAICKRHSVSMARSRIAPAKAVFNELEDLMQDQLVSAHPFQAQDHTGQALAS